MNRPYHHGDLKQSLLLAARQILDRNGVEAVTVRAVAREANVAHSAPANHFKDRASLLTALAIGVFDELADEFDSALARSEPTIEARLRAFGHATFDYAMRHPNRYRLLWRRDSLDSKDGRLQESGGAIFERLRSVLANRSPSIMASVDSAIITAWSTVHGYVSLRLDAVLVSGIDEVNGRAREDVVLDVLIAGLL